MTTTNDLIARLCPICKGAKWVCETDLSTPFDADKHDCAGVNCVCNPNGEFPDDVYVTAAIDSGSVKNWVQ